MQAAQNENITPLAEVSGNKESNQQKRKRLFKLLGIVVALAVCASYGYWKLVASKHITTDNAYAAADIADVSSLTGGTVKAVHVIDTQSVKAGEALVLLDDADAKLALKEAEANLTRSQADLQRLKLSFERRKKLSASGYISAEEITNSEGALKVAAANEAAAAANLEQAKINLDRTVVRAPVDGVVAKREVQLGQRITAGTHLLSVIPVSQIYVNANFKEVQLSHVKPGQSVTLHADMYGSSVTYHGRVVGVSGGTGAAFALIPAQNATGNWIKVVQRLPVRIALDPKELAEHPLEVGLSMRADINISH